MTLFQYRSGSSDQPETYSNKRTHEERQKREIQDIVYFFEKHGMAEKKRIRIANMLFESEVTDELTPIDLYGLYEEVGDRKIFEDGILKEEFGINSISDRCDILKVLRQCDDPIDYFLGFFCDEKLKELDVKIDEIREYLFIANLKAQTFQKILLTFSPMQKIKNTKFYILLRMAPQANLRFMIILVPN